MLANASRFLLLSNARTGSKLLHNALSQHPDMHWHDGEPFSRDISLPVLDWDSRIDELYAAHDGVKIQREQLTEAGWSWLGRANVQTIVLIRRDKQRQYFSWRHAMVTGDYSIDRQPIDRKILFGRSRMDAMIELWEAREQRAVDTCRDGLVVEYEALTSDWDAEISRVLAFLGVSNVSLPQGNTPASLDYGDAFAEF